MTPDRDQPADPRLPESAGPSANDADRVAPTELDIKFAPSGRTSASAEPSPLAEPPSPFVDEAGRFEAPGEGLELPPLPFDPERVIAALNKAVIGGFVIGGFGLLVMILEGSSATSRFMGALIGECALVVLGSSISIQVLRGINVPRYRQTGLVFLSAFGVAALAGSAAILVSAFGSNIEHVADRLGAFAAVAAVSGSFASFCMIGAGIDYRPWRWIGVAAIVLAFILSTISLTAAEPASWQLSFIGFAFSLGSSVALTIVAFEANLRPTQQWLRVTLVGLIWLIFTFVSMALIDPSVTRSQTYTQCLGVLALTTVVLVLVQSSLHRQNLRATPAQFGLALRSMSKQEFWETVESDRVYLRCTTCDAPIEFQLDQRGECASCGTVFSLVVRMAAPPAASDQPRREVL